MPSLSRHELNQLLLVDFTSFVQRVVQTVSPGATYEHNWHIEAMCYQLMRCYRGEIKRLIITVPPRHLKSICASVAFPAWVLARNPKLGSVVVTYSNELGDHQSRLFRAVVNADWYRAICPALEVEKDTATEFVTTKRGFRYATSVCGTLTGRGAHFMLIDDPMKSEDAFSKSGRDTVINWYRSTLAPRLDKKKDGCIILVMQRHHSHDLVGHLLESDPNGWVHLDLPAIAQEAADIAISDVGFYHRDPGDLLFPQREGEKELDQLRRDMGLAIFSAQYLQRPLSEEGLWIKRDWFRTYDHLPVRQPGDRIIQSYDTATKPNAHNDPSVCTTWLERKGAYFLIHVARAWLTFPELKQMYVDLRARFQPDVILIEDAGSGTSLIQDVSQLGSPRLIPGSSPKAQNRSACMRS